jgi:hypothetical protein
VEAVQCSLLIGFYGEGAPFEAATSASSSGVPFVFKKCIRLVDTEILQISLCNRSVSLFGFSFS